jgi:uncharacterized protein YigA (DUF484 family)
MKQPNVPSNIPVLTALTNEQVSEYLKAHPDFWVDKLDLLADMNLPHNPSGQTISLVERQVSVLRERNVEVRHRLNRLIENARANDVLFDKTKRLTLSLLNTKKLDDCLNALFFGLQQEFDIHFSQVLIIADPDIHIPSSTNKQARLVGTEQIDEHLPKIINNRRAICGQLNDSEKEFIFESKASEIGSTAIAPLYFENRTIGAIAIANRDPDFYRSSMNTLFLNYIADVLSRLLINYLPLSSNTK